MVGFEVKGVGSDCFQGKTLQVPGIGFRIIRSSIENPYGVFLARVLKLRSVVTSVLVNEVGGYGFIVRVSGASKFRSIRVGVEVRVGNLCSNNL